MQHHLLGLLYINVIEQVRDYKKYIMLVLIPAIIMLFIMMGSMVSEQEAQEASIIEVGLQMDMDNIYGNLLRSSFFSADHFDDFVHVEDLESGQEEGSIDGYDAYIRVPVDFFDALMYFRYSPVQVIIDADNPVVTYLISGVMESYGNYIRSVEASVTSLYDVMEVSGFDQDLRYSYNEQIALRLVKMLLNRNDAVRVITVGRYADIGEGTYVYIGSMVFFIWVLCLFIGIKWLEEDHQGLLARYIICGRSMTIYIIAYYLAIAFCLFLVTSVWHLLALSLLRGSGFNAILFFGITFLIICFNLSVVLLVANLIKNKNQLILIFASVGLVLCVAGGTIIPIYEMSPLMIQVAKLTPNYWMIQSLSSALTWDNMNEVQLFAIILGALALLANIVTALLIKKQWER